MYCISVPVFTSNGSIFAFGFEIGVYFPGLRFGMEFTVPYPMMLGLMLRYQSFIAPLCIRSWNSWRPSSSSTWDLPSGCWLSFSNTRKNTGCHFNGCVLRSIRNSRFSFGVKVKNGWPVLLYQVMIS